MHDSTAVFPAVPASLTVQALVSHAGPGVLTGFLNALGFRKLCEDRFSQFVPSMAVHRPGKILGSLAVMLAAGGEQIADVDQLRAATALFGAVASEATISRFMARVKDQPEDFSHGFATMQRTLRTKVWAAAGKRNPGRRATAADPLTMDIDASLVHVHSDKEKSAGTYKDGYGFSPLIAIVDYGQDNGTGEILAVMMRPGNKGAKDHIEVLTQALAQLPEDFYDSHGNLIGEKILIRTDSAGASREFLNHLHSLGIQFSTGHGPARAHHPRPPALQARQPGRLNRRPEPSTTRRKTKAPGSGTRRHRQPTQPSPACPKTARAPTPHQNTESAVSRHLMKQLG